MKLIKKLRFGFLEKPLSDLCYKHSHFVARHPWPYIIIPLIVTTAFGVGYFFRLDSLKIYELYTPTNGQGLSERDTIHELFPAIDGTYTPSRSTSWLGENNLIVEARDNGNILRQAHMEAVKTLNQYVINNITVQFEGVEYGYQNICLHFTHFCHTNPQIYAVDLMLKSPEGTDDLTYPTAKKGMRRFYVGNTLGEVKLDPLSRQIQEAKAWQLVYQVKSDGIYKSIGDLWQKKFEKEMLSYEDRDKLLDLSVFHSSSLDNELKKNSDNLIPKFLICVATLFIFSILCSTSFIWEYKVPYVDWARSKFIVSLAGLIGALMGVVTTVGFLRYCGYQYNSVVDAMPFVVIGVRLDNTFLMISAVHHTKRTLNSVERTAEAMSEAAVSITITVLTDILSFAVGIFTNFLAVQMFSIYISIAMTITYIYQITFLLGVLVLSIRSEERNAHSIVTKVITVAPTIDKPPLITRFFCLGSHVSISEVTEHKIGSTSVSHRDQSDNDKVIYQEGTWISRLIRVHYAPFLMRNTTRFGVLILYLTYMSISIYGCCIVRQGLEPSRLLVDDSYAKKYDKGMERYFWNIGVQAQIVFSNAGDMTDRANRDKIFDIIDVFANYKHSMGKEGVVFWLKSMKDYMMEFEQTSLDSLTNETFDEKLKYFLQIDENAEFRNDVHWDTSKDNTSTGFGSKSKIKAFRALVGLKNFSTSLKQIETVDQFRSIANDYPEYNISTFQLVWIFVDQYEQVLPNTLMEIFCGTGFMVLIAVFLIPSAMCTLWVVMAILSIDTGVIGLMTFWDINLDVISMITIIMSIGFSVDFTAHIAYAFVVLEGSTREDKTSKALGTLAWPIIQGGISTMMGVVVLAGGQSYILNVFFKTVFLVILLGLFHALIFLPVVLSVFSCKLSTKTFICSCSRDTIGETNERPSHKEEYEIDAVPEEPQRVSTSAAKEMTNSSRVRKMLKWNTSKSEIVPEDPAT